MICVRVVQVKNTNIAMGGWVNFSIIKIALSFLVYDGSNKSTYCGTMTTKLTVSGANYGIKSI